MKKITILTFLFLSFLGNCQILIKIDSLEVYNIIETEPNNEIFEGFGEGPYVYGYFTICNRTDKQFIIPQINHSMSYDMAFYFNYNEKVCSSLPLFFTDISDSLVIKPRDSMRFEYGALIMIDVELHKSHRYHHQSTKIIDHTEIFNLILPTFHIELTLLNSHVYKSPIYIWKQRDYFEINGRLIKKIYPIAENNQF